MGFISKALYKVIKGAVKLVYPRITVEGMENLPEGACIIVGNHAQMNAPIACELYFPGTHYTWCAQEMMHLKEVPPYAYKDFWSGKPKSVRWIFKIASYLIAPLAVCVFNNANCIGVYRDGVWTLDTHGSRSMANAQIVRRGNPGEMPIVADFEGQGTPELATVRNAAGPEVEIATSPEGSVTR